MRKIIALALLCLLMLVGSSASAQDQGDLIHQQLEKLMARQNPLTEDDIRTYLANIEAIYKLRFDYDQLPDVMKGIGAWTEERFAYVSTKMAVGMSALMRPDDSRNKAVAEFMKPTASEMALISRYQGELTRAMERIQTRYQAADSQ